MIGLSKIKGKPCFGTRLKSFNMTEFDFQMAKNWKQTHGDILVPNKKFDRLKIGAPDFPNEDKDSTKTFTTPNMSSRCTLSPVGMIQIL